MVDKLKKSDRKSARILSLFFWSYPNVLCC